MITELTKEQEAKLEEYTRMGLAIGLSTGRADRKRCEEIIVDVYAAGGLPAPKHIHWAESPVAGHEIVVKLTGNSGWEAPAFWGNQEISWLQFYRYFQVELNIEEAKKIEPLYNLACHVGWCWFFEEHAVLTERPTKINMIPKANKLAHDIPLKVLHSTTEKAIEYADGTGWYFLNGINVPEWLITEPYDIKKVMAIKNTEVRNEALKLGGPDVLIKELDAKVIDKETINPGGNYELYELMLNSQRRVYLRGYCPSSGKSFTEAVPPEVKTCAQALYWREEGSVELPKGGYTPPAMRT